MAFAVDEEVVFEVLALGGSLVDVGEVDFAVAEFINDGGEGAGLVAGGEEDGGFVVVGGVGGLVPDDEEASGVAGVVFDVFGDDGDVVFFGGEDGAECGGVLFFFDVCDGEGAGGHGAALGVGEVGGEPLGALFEDFGSGVDFGDVGEVGCDGEEVVVDGDEDFGADFGIGAEAAVECFVDAAACGVFDGDEAEVDFVGFDGLEDHADGFDGDVINTGAELLACGLVGEGSFGAEVADV